MADCTLVEIDTTLEERRKHFAASRHIFFDAWIAVIALGFLFPLLALIAILIRLESPGPALFRQTRTGLNGRTFQIYKFRSMRVQEDGDLIRQAARNDDRVTRLGAFLRASSLDELPQLLNVLRGEMALVGPRPHALAHDVFYESKVPNYRRRFDVRPGLTGWAQVNGSRGATPMLEDMERRIQLDLWYIGHQNIKLDLKIMITTVAFILMRKSDAY